MSFFEELDPDLVAKIEKVNQKIEPKLTELKAIALENQAKVLNAFRNNEVSDSHLAPSTGYGYDDTGREAIDKIYAESFGAEAALVRPQFISGTHAIATGLFGLLRPGDDLLYITGEPYDTLLEVVGITGTGVGSLKEYNVGFDFVDVKENGDIDFKGIKEKLTEKVKVVAIQRSRGYSSRPSYTIAQIKEMCDFVRTITPNVIIFADNCYGEFIELQEPVAVGVDLMAGSLIKNPGGGLAKTGGYLAGRADLVEKCAYRLTVPGVGNEAGAMLGTGIDILQGFFLAPHVAMQAVQGAVFTAGLLEEFDVESNPAWDAPRTDLIQTIELKEKEAMIRFCQAIQKYSPIDSMAAPEPSYMPGYVDDIIMAAGTFVQGASIELSSDGPIRPPYRLYLQGGLTYEHVVLAVSHAVQDVYYNK